MHTDLRFSDMNKLKVMTVVGTRPEVIRLACVLRKLDKYMEHILVHSGQNYDYELNEIFFDELELREPDYFLNARGSACETMAKIFLALEPIIKKEKPDALLVLGDTNSCLAAVVGKIEKVPVFHMEAGNRCFDQRVPEEINRKIVDHVSDMNLTYSELERLNLLREGIPADRIIKTGAPMREVLDYYGEKIEASNILERLELKPNDYFLFSCHRQENIESNKNFTAMVDILDAIAQKYGKRIIFSTHPRTKKRMFDKGVKLHSLVESMKPFGFLDYNKLQKNARCVITDSGTITEESSIVNFPALNIRAAQERPAGMDEGSVMLVGMNVGRVLQGLDILQSQGRGTERTIHTHSDYNMDNVSEKVVRHIMSYCHYVKRTVWYDESAL
jgi:UDP-N-acetyl-L-fucosamine synthase